METSTCCCCQQLNGQKEKACVCVWGGVLLARPHVESQCGFAVSRTLRSSACCRVTLYTGLRHVSHTHSSLAINWSHVSETTQIAAAQQETHCCWILVLLGTRIRKTTNLWKRIEYKFLSSLSDKMVLPSH